MTAATIDAIEAAVFARLQTLRAADKFRLVERWAGDVTQQEGVAPELGGATPLALLAVEGDDPVAGLGVGTLSGDAWQDVSRLALRVYVVVEDARGDDAATKGQTGLPGALALVQHVVTALAGLEVDGLYQNERLRYAGARPHLIRRGVAFYAYAVRFTALHENEIPAGAEPGTPAAGADLDITLVGEADAPPNPVARLAARTAP